MDLEKNFLTPEEAVNRSSESGDTVLIAHAEMYALYDKHLTDEKINRLRKNDTVCGESIFSRRRRRSAIHRAVQAHILVDEFQDINFAQKVMIDELLKGGACTLGGW